MDLFGTGAPVPQPVPGPGPDPAAGQRQLFEQMQDMAVIGDQLRILRPDMAPLGGVPMIPDNIVSAIADASIAALLRLQGLREGTWAGEFEALKPGDQQALGDSWLSDMYGPLGLPYDALRPYMSANQPPAPEAPPVLGPPTVQEFKESSAQFVPPRASLPPSSVVRQGSPTALERLAQRDLNPAYGMSPDAALRRMAAPQPKAAPFSPFG